MDQRWSDVEPGRREDPALLTGEATYTDDLVPPDGLHAAFVRSPYGHARVEGVDAADAEAAPGVVAAFTGADLAASDAPGVLGVEAQLPNQRPVETPVLARDRVRHAGAPVAVVVAEDRYAAHDAADRVVADYERLEAVVDARAALEEGAPTVHDSVPDNLGLDWRYGDDGDEVAAALEGAAHVVSYEATNQRVHPDAMEPRAVLAEPGGDGGADLTVRMATQAPHLEQGLLAETLGLEAGRVRVVAPAVGGGFGSKALPYPEQVAVGWAALAVDRPVGWAATRGESHLTDHHGRDFHTRGELALDDDGTFLALRTEAVQNIGAHLVWATSPAPNYAHLSSGAYRIPLVSGHLRAAYTNTAPVAPYRGAGRPEIVYLIERLVDRAAATLAVDPAVLRRRNLVPPDAFPYETPTGATYDSGDYEGALDLALERLDYAAWRERQAAAREEGRLLGVGLASFVENTGTAPGYGESCRVALEPGGTLRVTSGTADHGQGHATAFAAYLARELGVPAKVVEYASGDSAFEAGVAGTFGSRSVAVAGSALAEAAREVRERAATVAAEHLEADPADLAFEDGAFHVAGAPDRSVDLLAVGDLAAADGVELAATHTYVPEHYAHAFGTHAAVVEVDPDAGELTFHEYVAVDDCGVQFEPTVVEGQVHGGVAQGVGQALYEGAVYDEHGSLATGSLMDYALPKAFHVPEIRVDDTVTPSPHTPTGAKGVGEGGAIVAPPAVVNAVVDALAPLGVEDLAMPVTGERVWRAVRDAA